MMVWRMHVWMVGTLFLSLAAVAQDKPVERWGLFEVALDKVPVTGNPYKVDLIDTWNMSVTSRGSAEPGLATSVPLFVAVDRALGDPIVAVGFKVGDKPQTALRAVGRGTFFAVTYDVTRERDNVCWHFGDADRAAPLDTPDRL